MSHPLLPFQERLAARIAAEAGKRELLTFPGSVGKEQICAAAVSRTLVKGERALVVVDKVLVRLWRGCLEDAGLTVSAQDDGDSVMLLTIGELRAQTSFDRHFLASSPLHRDWDLFVSAWRDCLHARSTQRHHATDQLARLACRAWYVASASKVPPYRHMEIGRLGRDLLAFKSDPSDFEPYPASITRPGVILRPSSLAERLIVA